MFSSGTCSALTPKNSSTMPPTAITAAPMRNAVATSLRLPDAIRLPNRSGPVIPPIAVPTAKKKAIASARVSIGKISLTVR